MSIVVLLVIISALLALSFAAFNYLIMKRMPEGNEKMREIAYAIRIGARAFISYEYKILIMTIMAVSVVVAILMTWHASLALLLGAFMSAMAGFVGMKAGTYANVRVTCKADQTRNIGETVKVAFRGSSIMGLSVGGFALLGLSIVFVVFGIGLGQLEITDASYKNLIGLSFTPFIMTLSGYALGCSMVAMFNRVGGGIYTKAADMGADLVGKTEAHIPEDDPRNPAVIADNVGDNVGDIAGMGSDLLESYVGSVSSGIILAYYMFAKSMVEGTGMTADLLRKLIYYPMIFVAIGLLSCCVGIATILFKKNMSQDPRKDLNLSTYISSGLTIILGFFVAHNTFSRYDASMLSASLGFSAGFLSPWVASAIGVIAGVIIGAVAEYYTSDKFRPTQQLAQSSLEGPALTITQGLALGMKSAMVPCIVLGLAIMMSYQVAGMYGVAMAAMGMLSFVTATVAIDSYGPISDNAGGIAEMAGLDPAVRRITDTLDSVGNTTAAIGKGFAIGSGALAALSLMISYLYSFNDFNTPLLLNIVQPMTLAGAIIGGALPFLFSGMLIEAVVKAARKMVDEVRRQFREIKGLLEGTAQPDYKTCIEISTKGAIAEMKVPSLMAILVPVLSGFILGPHFVGGLLIGSIVTSIMIAIFSGNAGGAWDNSKKYIEAGALEGHGKGSETHAAAVIGDTVGDPLKDTVGPCLDIFIKIMATVSLVSVAVFSNHNLLNWLNDLVSKLF